MILVTGGTGFIGRALIRHLVEAGYPVRTLIRPSPKTPRLPVGVPVEVAVVSLGDERGLRAALRGVDAVFHLASAESQGAGGDLQVTDIQGTLNLATAAAAARVRRLVYISHLGADRASAFPVLKAKAIAEEHIRKSGVPHTIFRSAIVYGPEDRFTVPLARLLRASPGIFPLPGDGRASIQPLWVEDLVTCMRWSLDDPESQGKTFEVGGSEAFSVRQTIEIILQRIRKRRLLVAAPLPWLRGLTVLLESTVPGFPASGLWLDYFSVHRICPVDNMPRFFGLMPARFSYRIDYLNPPKRPGLLARLRRPESE